MDVGTVQAKIVVDASDLAKLPESARANMARAQQYFDQASKQMNAAMGSVGAGLVDAFGRPVAGAVRGAGEVEAATKRVVSGMQAAETASGSLTGGIQALGTVMSQTGQAGSLLSNVLSAMTSPIGLVTEAVGLMTVAFIKAMESVSHQVEATKQMIAISGLGAEAADDLMNTMELVGVGSDKVSLAMFRLATDIETGGEALGRLDIAIKDNSGSLKTEGALFLEARDRIAQMTSASERATAARELFGRGARDLLPVLSLTSAEYAALTERVKGYSDWNEQSQKTGDRFVLSTREVELSITGLWQAIGLKLAPTLTDLNLAFAQWVKSVKDGVAPAFERLLPALQSIGSALSDIWTILASLRPLVAPVAQALVFAFEMVATAVNLALTPIMTLYTFFTTKGNWFAPFTAAAETFAKRMQGVRESIGDLGTQLKGMMQTGSIFGDIKIPGHTPETTPGGGESGMASKNELALQKQLIDQRLAAELQALDIGLAATKNALAAELATREQTTMAEISNIELKKAAVVRAMDQELALIRGTNDAQVKARADVAAAFGKTLDELTRGQIVLYGQMAAAKADEDLKKFVTTLNSDLDRALQAVTQSWDHYAQAMREAAAAEKLFTDGMDVIMQGLDGSADAFDQQAMALREGVIKDWAAADKALAGLQATLLQTGPAADAQRLAFQLTGKALEDTDPKLRSAIEHFTEVNARLSELRGAQAYAEGMLAIQRQAALLGDTFDALGPTISAVTSEILRLGTTSQGTVTPEIEALQAQLNELRGVQELKGIFTDVFSTIADAVDKLVEGVQLGTQTMAEAWNKLWKSIGLSLISSGVQKLIKGLGDTLWDALFGGNSRTSTTNAAQAAVLSLVSSSGAAGPAFTGNTAVDIAAAGGGLFSGGNIGSGLGSIGSIVNIWSNAIKGWDSGFGGVTGALDKVVGGFGTTTAQLASLTQVLGGVAAAIQTAFIVKDLWQGPWDKSLGQSALTMGGLGASIGTAVFPGVGTVIGGAAGALAGLLAGSGIWAGLQSNSAGQRIGSLAAGPISFETFKGLGLGTTGSIFATMAALGPFAPLGFLGQFGKLFGKPDVYGPKRLEAAQAANAAIGSVTGGYREALLTGSPAALLGALQRGGGGAAGNAVRSELVLPESMAGQFGLTGQKIGTDVVTQWSTVTLEQFHQVLAAFKGQPDLLQKLRGSGDVPYLEAGNAATVAEQVKQSAINLFTAFASMEDVRDKITGLAKDLTTSMSDVLPPGLAASFAADVIGPWKDRMLAVLQSGQSVEAMQQAFDSLDTELDKQARAWQAFGQTITTALDVDAMLPTGFSDKFKAAMTPEYDKILATLKAGNTELATTQVADFNAKLQAWTKLGDTVRTIQQEVAGAQGNPAAAIEAWKAVEAQMNRAVERIGTAFDRAVESGDVERMAAASAAYHDAVLARLQAEKQMVEQINAAIAATLDQAASLVDTVVQIATLDIAGTGSFAAISTLMTALTQMATSAGSAAERSWAVAQGVEAITTVLPEAIRNFGALRTAVEWLATGMQTVEQLRANAAGPGAITAAVTAGAAGLLQAQQAMINASSGNDTLILLQQQVATWNALADAAIAGINQWAQQAIAGAQAAAQTVMDGLAAERDARLAALDANIGAIEAQQEAQQAANDSALRSISVQTDAIQKQLAAAQEWSSAVENMNKFLFTLQQGGLAPISRESQLTMARDAFSEAMQKFTSAPTAQGLSGLQDLAQTLLQAGADVLQKPSPEYQALFASVSAQLVQANAMAGTHVTDSDLLQAQLDQLEVQSKILQQSNTEGQRAAQDQIKAINAQKARISADFETQTTAIRAALATQTTAIQGAASAEIAGINAGLGAALTANATQQAGLIGQQLTNEEKLLEAVTRGSGQGLIDGIAYIAIRSEITNVLLGQMLARLQAAIPLASGRDMVTQGLYELHNREMVIPADVAEDIRQHGGLAALSRGIRSAQEGAGYATGLNTTATNDWVAQDVLYDPNGRYKLSLGEQAPGGPQWDNPEMQAMQDRIYALQARMAATASRNEYWLGGKRYQYHSAAELTMMKAETQAQIMEIEHAMERLSLSLRRGGTGGDVGIPGGLQVPTLNPRVTNATGQAGAGVTIQVTIGKDAIHIDGADDPEAVAVLVGDKVAEQLTKSIATGALGTEIRRRLGLN